MCACAPCWVNEEERGGGGARERERLFMECVLRVPVAGDRVAPPIRVFSIELNTGGVVAYVNVSRCDSAATPSVSPTGLRLNPVIFLVRYGARALLSPLMVSTASTASTVSTVSTVSTLEVSTLEVST